jgi:hypothetical protein
MSLMENINSTQHEQLVDLLAQRVEVNHTDLAGCYFSVLRESLFSNRAEVKPRMLKQIAAEEVEALLNFLKQADFSGAERGEKMHQAGFNVGAILKLSQVTRQFLITRLESHQVAPMLEIVDAYQQTVIVGFIQSIDKTNLIDLDQARTIFQRGGS